MKRQFHISSDARKIIFLDIDGVLNCDDTWNSEHADGFATLDPTMCDRLQKIVQATGAIIVLSSTWRTAHPKGHASCNEAANEHHCLPKLEQWLADRGMTIHSHTPVIKGFGWSTYITRGTEIDEWFEINPDFKDADFIIIDDLSDWEFTKEQEKRMVRTDPAKGLQDCDVEYAISLLS